MTAKTNAQRQATKIEKEKQDLARRTKPMLLLISSDDLLFI
jgi:hypothetical protein